METLSPIREALGLPPKEYEFDFQAALYFLKDGYFLFRNNTGERPSSKFVTAADVTAAFSKQETDTGWIGENIMRCGYTERGHWYVFFLPMQKVNILLHGEGLLNVPLPPLVMVGVGYTYSIFAMKEKHFSPRSPLFAAPFPNVQANSSGTICWGNAKPPEAKHTEAKRMWDLFLASEFNGHTIEQKSKAHPQDIRQTLLELAASNAKVFPLKDLVPIRGYRCTLDHVLDELLKGR